MWKLIVGSLIIGNSAFASIEVQMNLKALYADKIEKMTEEQKNYINDNMDTIKEKTNDTLKAETKALQKAKYLNDSNVIEFLLNPNGTIENFKYLNKSNENRFNQLSKKVCEETIKKIPLPKETTPIRLIFEYRIQKSNMQQMESTTATKYDNNNLERGNTRIDHSMDKQIRTFETSKDGFVNITTTPNGCINFSLLTENNQKVTAGFSDTWWNANLELRKGKYKILIQTKQTCIINMQYP